MEKFTRHIAQKISVQEIIGGTYIQEAEDKPNYLLTGNQQKIYRVNLIATVIAKEQVGTATSYLIDDGTGNIQLRKFESKPGVANPEIGAVVLVTGRMRTFNNEQYVAPETLKSVNPLWLKVRSLEIKRDPKDTADNFTPPRASEKPAVTVELINQKKEESVQLSVEEISITETTLPSQKIVELIQTLDKGEGVLIEEVLEKSLVQDTENVLEKMLEKGDIFKITPARVKVL